jgi:hypothetical protein
MEIDLSKYNKDIQRAIQFFWKTRKNQQNKQLQGNFSDQGNRGAVTGGQQMNGFLDLLTKICIDLGIKDHYIYTKNNHLPGFFRPSKDWDFIVLSPNNELLVAVELKSQVGSFGNNFNNRTEEAIGSAVDLWTAYKWKAFYNQMPPWIGYLILVEKIEKSCSLVSVYEPYFKVRDEFYNTSYMQRYNLLCKKLMIERHYSGACLIWSASDLLYGSIEQATSIDSFLLSLIAFLLSKKDILK